MKRLTKDGEPYFVKQIEFEDLKGTYFLKLPEDPYFTQSMNTSKIISFNNKTKECQECELSKSFHIDDKSTYFNSCLNFKFDFFQGVSMKNLYMT